MMIRRTLPFVAQCPPWPQPRWRRNTPGPQDDPDQGVIDAASPSDGGMPEDGTISDAVADASAPPIPVGRCDGEAPAVESGICDAFPGTDEENIFLRGTLLGPDGPLEQGQLLVVGQEIACVGCDCTTHPAYAGATRIECGTAVISPGLINPHDHITFTEGAPIDHGETRYDHDMSGGVLYQRLRMIMAPGQPRWSAGRIGCSVVHLLVGSGGATGGVRNLDRCPTTGTRIKGGEVQTFSSVMPTGDFRRTVADYRYTETEVARFSPAPCRRGHQRFAQEEFRCQSTSFDGVRLHGT